MKTLVAVLLLLAALPAQVVRLANHSSVPFEGWKRTTIDQAPPCLAGSIGGARFVVGREIGLDVRVVDVWCTIPSGGKLTLNLAKAVPFDFLLAPLPADPMAHFGGLAAVAGTPLQIVSLIADGAAWTVQLRARTGRMLCTNVWLSWYPDQPAWCSGEAIVVASNPGVPDMGEAIPAGFNLTFGDAIVRVPGRAFGAPLVDAGTTLADGQGKGVPLTFVWLRHLKTAGQWASSGAVADCGIGAVGISKLLPDGNPLVPEGMLAIPWANARLKPAIDLLHTWSPPIVGPAGISGSAGEQEDSLLHPGGEAMLPDGAGSEWIRYLSAIKLFSERPANHLEADGTELSIERHPQLLFWDSRVHWHTGVSPDRLGKPRTLDVSETHNRWGVDVQHTYVGALASSCRLTGSPACQWLLSRLATAYLLQRTVPPSWSTSGYESAREWGCEGMFVVRCWWNLEDRAQAVRVVGRWQARVVGILIPRMEGKDLLVVWDKDPRVNPIGLGAQWWQESFASYLIDMPCRLIGPPQGRAVALRIARRVFDVAWTQQPDGHWRAQPQGPIDGSSNPENPATDSFNAYAMPCCVALILRNEPTNAKALAIWAQLMVSTADNARRWMPSGVK